MTIGLISDTHGLLRPEALAALRGCDGIIHGGDVGKPEILTALAALAPVTVVCGNVDRGPWADALPETAIVAFGKLRVFVIHDRNDLTPGAAAAAGARVVISGHSHKSLVEERGGLLYVNPGAAGPRRFRFPVTVGKLHVGPRGTVRAEVIELEPGPPG